MAPPSVKAALSVSFGQRAPHRASTRDSPPVRRTLPPSYDRDHEDQRRSPSRCRSQSRDYPDRDYSDKDRNLDRERHRDRDRDRDGDRGRARERDRDWRDDYDCNSRYGDREEGRKDYKRSRRDEYRSRSRSRSRSTSRSSAGPAPFKRHSGPGGGNNSTSKSSNLAKLRDLYGDASNQKSDAGMGSALRRDSSDEEVIRLGGGSWK